MEDDDSFKLEDTYIDSHVNRTSEVINAYFKDTNDLHFDGMHDDYANYSMTRMQGSQYLMHVEDGIYCVDIEKLSADGLLEMKNDRIIKCFIEGEYMLVVRHISPMAILRNLQEIGQIELIGKYKFCKNIEHIRGR